MIKVAECSLCGKYFRTGQIRQVIEKAMGEGNKWVEWRKAVCNNCYKVIIKGQGVTATGGNGYLTDLINEPSGLQEVVKAAKDFEDRLGESIDGKGRERILKESTPKKERKARGKRVSVSKSKMAEALGSSDTLDEEEDKPEPKKRGRKPKLATAEAIREKTYRSIDDVREDAIKHSMPTSADDVRVEAEESATVLETASPVEELMPINAKDRNALKNQVRQALENNPEVLYSKIAEKLGIDEGLVSQLVDELELEAAG